MLLSHLLDEEDFAADVQPHTHDRPHCRVHPCKETAVNHQHGRYDALVKTINSHCMPNLKPLKLCKIHSKHSIRVTRQIALQKLFKVIVIQQDYARKAKKTTTRVAATGEHCEREVAMLQRVASHASDDSHHLAPQPRLIRIQQVPRLLVRLNSRHFTQH